jgi:hypothetical protein
MHGQQNIKKNGEDDVGDKVRFVILVLSVSRGDVK